MEAAAQSQRWTRVHTVQLPTFPIRRNQNCFHIPTPCILKSFAQTLPFKNVSDKTYQRRVKSERHQTHPTYNCAVRDENLKSYPQWPTYRCKRCAHPAKKKKTKTTELFRLRRYAKFQPYQTRHGDTRVLPFSTSKTYLHPMYGFVAIEFTRCTILYIELLYFNINFPYALCAYLRLWCLSSLSWLL